MVVALKGIYIVVEFINLTAPFVLFVNKLAQSDLLIRFFFGSCCSLHLVFSELKAFPDSHPVLFVKLSDWGLL